MHRIALVAFFLCLAPAAIADVPVVDDAVLKAPCDEARTLDGCPTCTCKLRTSTSPYPGLDERTSDIVIGAIVDVEGKRPDGEDYAAAHVLLGTSTKLEHLGRVAESFIVDENHFRQYDISAGRAEMQMCPGGCQFEAVGLIHPFEVKTSDMLTKNLDDGTVEETVGEETRLVLCFEAAGGLTCASLPIAFEKRVHRPPMAPGMKDKVLSREGFKRSWKFGKAGDIALGKATGKLAPVLANPAAHKLSMMDLYMDSDVRGLDRWPAPAAP